MGDKSAIEWTDATWNPFRGTAGRWACTRVSPGCDYCYAAKLTRRFGGPDYAQPGRPLNDTLRLDVPALLQPFRWRQPRRVFVHSMTDTFHPDVSDAWLDKLFGVMALTPRHTYQVLTKRPSRMEAYLRGEGVAQRIGEYSNFATILTVPGLLEVDGAVMAQWHRAGVPWPLPNVWLGTSIEMDGYTWRAERLRATPAAVRFISAEPLLGPLDSLDLTGIDWLIVGGESGGAPERRLVKPCRHLTVKPADFPEYFAPDGVCTLCNGTGWEPKLAESTWVWKLREMAEQAGVAFFFKQWGGHTPKSGGRLLDGRTWDEYPTGRELAVGTQR